MERATVVRARGAATARRCWARWSRCGARQSCSRARCWHPRPHCSLRTQTRSRGSSHARSHRAPHQAGQPSHRSAVLPCSRSQLQSSRSSPRLPPPRLRGPRHCSCTALRRTVTAVRVCVRLLRALRRCARQPSLCSAATPLQLAPAFRCRNCCSALHFRK